MMSNSNAADDTTKKMETAADDKTKQMETLKPNTVAVQSTDDEISTPSGLTAIGRAWYEAFVSWYKKPLSPQLDPDNIPNITPRTETESIFLNYLQFHYKYLGGRSSFEDCIWNRQGDPCLCIHVHVLWSTLLYQQH